MDNDKKTTLDERRSTLGTGETKAGVAALAVAREVISKDAFGSLALLAFEEKGFEGTRTEISNEIARRLAMSTELVPNGFMTAQSIARLDAQLRVVFGMTKTQEWDGVTHYSFKSAREMRK